MLDTNTAILSMDLYLSREFNKSGHIASQKTQLRLLHDHYGKKICRRTLCRHRAKQREASEIKSVKRHVKGADGKPKFRSTVTVLLRAGYEKLCRALKRVRPIIKLLFKQTWPKKKEARSLDQAFKPESPPLSREAYGVKWKNLISSLG